METKIGIKRKWDIEGLDCAFLFHPIDFFFTYFFFPICTLCGGVVDGEKCKFLLEVAGSC